MIVEQLMESKAAVVVLCIGVSVALSMSCAATGPQPPTPDTILVGQFITLDPSKPRVEALALLKGRIVATGTRAEIERIASDTTRRFRFPVSACPASPTRTSPAAAPTMPAPASDSGGPRFTRRA